MENRGSAVPVQPETAGRLPLILLTFLATGCQEDCTRPEPLILAGQFAGSASCTPCHQEIHGVWLESGHPYGLVRAAGAAPVGAFPALSAFAGDPVDPPGEHTWSAISYVGGGYGPVPTVVEIGNGVISG